jgi:hypothetical protein
MRSAENYARNAQSREMCRGSLERGEGFMKLNIRMYLGSAAFASALLSAPFSGAQQKQAAMAQANISYDLSRETAIQGTVVSFTAASSVPPLGAHVTIQTASGAVDVHLGNATLLKSNDIFLAAGDSVRIVGENQPYGSGSFFAARILQKGSQSVALRNANGIPLSPKRAASTSGAHTRLGGAL